MLFKNFQRCCFSAQGCFGPDSQLLILGIIGAWVMSDFIQYHFAPKLFADILSWATCLLEG